LASLGVSADVARFGSLDAQVLGLAVDALIAGALRVDGLVERTIAIEQGAHQAAFFPVGVFDTAWAPDELGMLAGLSRAGGKEQGAAEALGPKAVGVLKLVCRRHAQACPTAWDAIGSRGTSSWPWPVRVMAAMPSRYARQFGTAATGRHGY